MTNYLEIDVELLKKYKTNAPRYTLYPTALEFSDEFNYYNLRVAIDSSSKNKLSIYIHIPSKFPSQKLIDESLMPNTEQKFIIYQSCINFLVNNGYKFIGMNNFIKDKLLVNNKYF